MKDRLRRGGDVLEPWEPGHERNLFRVPRNYPAGFNDDEVCFDGPEVVRVVRGSARNTEHGKRPLPPGLNEDRERAERASVLKRGKHLANNRNRLFVVRSGVALRPVVDQQLA